MRPVRLVTLSVGLSTLMAGLVALPAAAETVVVETVRVSVASDGTQADAESSWPAISADGGTITYRSSASNLVFGDTNGYTDVFAYDVAGGTTTRISVADGGAQADGESFDSAISGDGGTIVYQSSATNLVSGDTNGYADVFAYDVAAGTTTRISVATGGAQANSDSYDSAISADGGTIVYTSYASNLVPGDTNGTYDVFAYDVAAGTTTRISIATDGTQANGDSEEPTISGDGATIVYTSSATNLVFGDTNGYADIFAYDVAAGTTTRISVATDGTQADDFSYEPAISADGATIVYASGASNLAPGDTNGTDDVFAYGVAAGTTTRISVAVGGAQANLGSSASAISGDGGTIVYSSGGSNLVPGDTNSTGDVFAYDVATGITTRISVATGGTQANAQSYEPATSADGATIVYTSSATNLVADDTRPSSDVFVTRLSNTDPTHPQYNPFDDDDRSIFEDDIEWLYGSGITEGCGERLFCPKLVVSRGQMAAFLRRALELPAASQDYFTDDESSIFEDDINRLAESGITKGCGSTNFCPAASVTREQMAAFLVRAFGYTDDGGGDVFADDDTSIFEADIDTLATARITLGCNPPANSNFCPVNPVSREQMAAFLHRALD